MLADSTLAPSAHTPTPDLVRRPDKFEQAVQRYIYALDRLHDEPDTSDEMSAFLTDAVVAAEDAVMFEPAQNIEQLRMKADILFSDFDSTPPDRHIRAFFSDLVRLTGGKPSRVFNSARWLARFERAGGGYVANPDRIWLMWPDLDNAQDLLAELDARGGKSAVLDLIRARTAEKA